jgi:predicted short-subunit dehydrogenase-like oxidoreductase (DUF2520 family)
MITPSVALIGAGKVGTTLMQLWQRAGYNVRAVYSRTPAHAQALADKIGVRVCSTLVDVVTAADLIVCAVADDALPMVSEQLAALSIAPHAIIHTSGAHDRRVWSALAARGWRVGSLHVAYPFASLDPNALTLAGAVCVVEASDETLMLWLRGLVDALGGRYWVLPPDGKALYHAALTITSNYTVTLYAWSQALLAQLGIASDDAALVLQPLLDATAHNIAQQGIPSALTGPLVRGDVSTVAAHLVALSAQDHALYRALAAKTLPLVTARGVDASKIQQLLHEDLTYAPDNTGYTSTVRKTSTDPDADGV